MDERNEQSRMRDGEGQRKRLLH